MLVTCTVGNKGSLALPLDKTWKIILKVNTTHAPCVHTAVLMEGHPGAWGLAAETVGGLAAGAPGDQGGRGKVTPRRDEGSGEGHTMCREDMTQREINSGCESRERPEKGGDPPSDISAVPDNRKYFFGLETHCLNCTIFPSSSPTSLLLTCLKGLC